jgi:eukaryotic-like serine/threonine-protein kinase
MDNSMEPSINGYRLVAPISMVGSGNSLWTIGLRDGEAFFIKRFLRPTYPVPEAPGSRAVRQAKAARCREFESYQTSVRTVLARLASAENIVPITDFFRWNAHYYQAAPLVHQEADAYDRLKCSSLKEIVSVILGITRGLAGVHVNDLVHGDVRLANIICAITPSGYIPKIVDFGSSFFSAAPPSPENFVGDPAYYSPELASYIAGIGVGNDITIKSDVFALGLVAAELLGAHRLGGPGVAQYAWEGVSQCRPLHAWPRKVPQQVQSLVEQMLSAAPNKRPDLDALASDLERLV